MKKRMVLIVWILLIFWILFINKKERIKAKEKIYDKIDKIVEINRSKAEKLYEVLWDIKEYLWEKLWKEEKTIIKWWIDLSNIYWFNLNKIFWYNPFTIEIVNKDMLKWLDLKLYWPELNMYYLNTVSIKRYKEYIYLMQINNDYYKKLKEKYQKIIEWKIFLDSEEFEQVENKDWDKNYNIFNVRWWFAQTNPINQHFIKDENWDIKWIWFYAFEWNGSFPWSFKYKIYSVKKEAMMEVDIEMYNIWKMQDTNLWLDWMVKSKIENDSYIEYIETEKFKEKYFKKWYFDDWEQWEEYWKEMKQKIEYYEEVVRSS